MTAAQSKFFMGLFFSLLALPVLAEDALPPAELPELQMIVRSYQSQSGEIARKADAELQKLREKTIDDLRSLQDSYTRAAKLEQALAIRSLLTGLELAWKSPSSTIARAVAITGFEGSVSGVKEDPGSLYSTEAESGTVLFFRVTGSDTGSVWGSDVYTVDSRLAKAAVHAGAIKLGETGLVKVTILPGQDSYSSTSRHDITTSSWSTYHKSFKVEPVGMLVPAVDPKK